VLDHIHGLLLIPNLQRLSLADVRLWARFHSLTSDARSRTSNVTSWAFSNCVTPVDKIADITSRLIALNPFHYGMLSSDEEDHSADAFRPWIRAFYNTLYLRRESLQDLFITDLRTDQDRQDEAFGVYATSSACNGLGSLYTFRE